MRGNLTGLGKIDAGEIPFSRIWPLPCSGGLGAAGGVLAPRHEVGRASLYLSIFIDLFIYLFLFAC